VGVASPSAPPVDPNPADVDAGPVVVVPHVGAVARTKSGFQVYSIKNMYIHIKIKVSIF